MEPTPGADYLPRMDSETRAAITTLSETMNAGFARMDRYFELQQKQFLEWRAELRGEVGEVRGEVGEVRGEVGGLRGALGELRASLDVLSERVGRLEHEVVLLRDYVTREIGEIRLELRDLRRRSGQTEELRREIAELAVRVDRLERRQPD